MGEKKSEHTWIKVLELGELPEGRVKTVLAGHKNLAMTNNGGLIAALDNKCPHQGGPLGEGSIENGLLRCPWHGWDFDSTTGKSPGGFDDGIETFPVETRDDGIYVGVPAELAHERTVSDVIVETLSKWGVRAVFGMVGHSNLGLADAIRILETQGDMTFYGIRHEGAAAFAVSAYGKLTGRLAACLSIAGPGATNLLTGLWDANVDRAPALALTGQVNTQVLGPGAFQEIDLAGAFGKVAVWAQPVHKGSQHAELANLACKNALVKKGVSHLIFPDEVQTHPSGDTPSGCPVGRAPALTITPSGSSIDQSLDLLKKAKRPVIIVGYGARDAMESVISLAETLNSPIITTFKAKGLVSDDHPLGCGVLGRSGTPIASWMMNEADCLLVLGSSFSNHTGITPKKPTIQVDYDAMTLGKFHPVDVPVWGEIAATAGILKNGLSNVNNVDQRPDVATHWEIWRAEKQSRMKDDFGNGINSSLIFDSMNRKIPANAIITVDVGNNTYSFGRYFECTHQSVLMSGYLGSIGFSLPAAMGAWAATQEDDPKFKGRPVVSISGDGGFGQYLAEVTTAVKYGMDITHVLLHNKQLGKISKEQKAGEWDVWQTSLHNPDFSKFVDNCGGLGLRVTEPSKLDEALGAALNHKGFSLVEIMSDPELI